MTNIKRGIYHTEYGNACMVSGRMAKKAWDIDGAEWVPLSMVAEFIRPVTPDDARMCQRQRIELRMKW